MFSVLLPASTASGQHHGYGALPSLALRRWFLNTVLCREGQLLTQEPFKLGGEIKQCLGKLNAKDFSLKAGVTARQEGNSLPFPSPLRPSVPYSSGPAICVLQVSSAITVFPEAEGDGVRSPVASHRLPPGEKSNQPSTVYSTARRPVILVFESIVNVIYIHHLGNVAFIYVELNRGRKKS